MTQVRAATEADYPDFVRLFPELAIDDAPPRLEQWVREMVPTSLVAERDGRVVGCAVLRVLPDRGWVRVLISDPALRRSGIARALLEATRARFRELELERWCLNVKPENVAATSLYASFGFAEKYRSHALRMPWTLLETLPPSEGTVRSDVAGGEFPAMETELKLVPGILASQLAYPDRHLAVAERDGAPVAAGLFDVAFPGVYPLAATSLATAHAVLDALRPHARHETVDLVIPDRRELAEAFLASGAKLRLETAHWEGEI